MIPRSSLASGILVVVASILLPLALVSGWLAAVVTDTDSYVDTVAPLASEPLVQSAVEVRLERVALEAIDLDKREQQLNDLLADGSLPPRLRVGLSALSGTARGAITATVHNAVVRVIRDPEFAVAWAEANRSAHEQLVAVLSGEDSELVDSDGRISIQLDTLLTTVFSILDDEGLVDAAALPELQASFAFVKADDLERAQRYYDLLDRLGYWLPVLWLLLVGLAVLLARNRRRAVRFLAYAAIVGVVLLAIGLKVARAHVTGLVGPEDTDVVRAVWDILFVALRASMRALLVAALVALVLTWLTGPARSAVRVRQLAVSPGRSVSAVTGPAAAMVMGAAVLAFVIWVV
ncbi:hypothetical protein [Nocardioides sp.]|uniref:hypothetical protein n=1 Tax=Nocardioides sp. TaxID=35761 RepID=UPI003D14BD4A